MHRFILTIVMGFVFLAVNAQPVTHQRVFDTIPFIPDHHQNRLEIFENEPMEYGQIIFLGNSITEGGNWKDLTGLPNALNRGIGGDITYGVLQRLDDIIERKPLKVFLLIGINDIGKDIPPPVIAENIKNIVVRIKTELPEVKIIIQSILPVNPEYPGFPQHYDKEYQVLIANQLIEKTAMEEGVVYINLYPYFLDHRQRLREDLTTDGLHLNQKGYLTWVDLLRKADLL